VGGKKIKIRNILKIIITRYVLGKVKAVELAPGGLGIRAHIGKKDPVAHLKLGERVVGDDAVDRVARGTENSAGVRLALVVCSRGLLEEHLGLWLGVVIEDHVHGAVEAVRNIVHERGGGLDLVALLVDIAVLYAARDDVGRERHALGRKVATGLSDDLDRCWEELVDQWPEAVGDCAESERALFVAGEAAYRLY